MREPRGVLIVTHLVDCNGLVAGVWGREPPRGGQGRRALAGAATGRGALAPRQHRHNLGKARNEELRVSFHPPQGRRGRGRARAVGFHQKPNSPARPRPHGKLMGSFHSPQGRRGRGRARAVGFHQIPNSPARTRQQGMNIGAFLTPLWRRGRGRARAVGFHQIPNSTARPRPHGKIITLEEFLLCH